MDDPDVLAVYNELEDLNKTVNAHSNHLSGLETRTKMIWDVLRFTFPAIFTLLAATLTAVVIIALR